MSGQFNRRDFEQNPSNMKKKRSKKDWDTNNASELCSEEVLTKQEIKEIQEDNWVEKHVPKPSKREQQYSARINQLENESLKAPLSKKEAKELRKLTKKRKKLYKYRHRDLSSNHFFLKCCLTTLVLVVVLSCTVVFGGYRLFVEPRTGITLFETFDILNGVFNVDEKKIITQKVDVEKDSQLFFDSLQTALYLSKPFKIDDLLDLIPASEGGTGGESASVSDLFAMAGVADSNDSDSKTGNINFDKLLEDTKFDFSSLKNFDETSPSPVWEITDKTIAAVMQNVILNADKIPALSNLLGEKVKISEVVAVRQCIISSNSAKENTMQLTVQVKIRNLVTQIVESSDLGDKSGIVKSAMPLILKIVPESIFLNAVTTPQVDKAPVLGINSINEELLQRFITNIDKNLLNGQIETIFNQVGQTIFNTIKTIDEMAAEKQDGHGITIIPSDKNNVNGTISINVLQAAMKALNIENVTSAEFLLMVKHLHLIDLENGDDVDQYIKNNYNEDKTISQEAFITSRDNLFSAYGVDPEKVQHIKADNFIEELTSVQDDIFLSNENLYKGDYETLKSNSKISDAALGYVMNSLISKELGSDFKMEIKLLDMKDKSMDIVASLDLTNMVDALIGGDLGSLKPLLMSIFPKHLFIKIIVPYIENDESEGAPQFDVIFNYMVKIGNETIDDSVAQKKSDAMFETMSKIMSGFGGDGESFNKQSIVNKIKDAIYPALDNMNIEGADIKIEFSQDGIQFPTVFDVMASIVNKDTPEGDAITAPAIKASLEKYYYYDSEAIGNDYSKYDQLKHVNLSSEYGFVTRELIQKFFMKGYVKDGQVESLKNISDNQVFDAIKGVGEGLSTGHINEVIDVNLMKNNTKPAEKGNLAITALEFGKMISMSSDLNGLDIGFYKDFKFINVELENSLLKITVVAELDKTIGNDGGFGINNFATQLLYMKAEIDLNEIIENEGKKAFKTTISINDAGENDIDTLIRIISKLANADFDQSTVANNLGEALYNAWTEFDAQGIGLTPSNNGAIAGFTSTNIYALIGKAALGKDNYKDGDDEHLKEIIRKLNNPNQEFTTQELPALTERDDDIATDTDTGKQWSLLEAIPNGDDYKLQIAGTYIGRQFRKIVKDMPGFDLRRFAIFNKPYDPETGNLIPPSSNVYETHPDTDDFFNVIKGLGISDLIKTQNTGQGYENNIFTDYGASGDKGLMFAHFGVDTTKLLTADSSLRALLPEKLYSGAFLDLSKLGTNENAVMCTYINDLSLAEMNLLTVLAGGTDITTPVMETLNNVISNDISISILGETITVELTKILNFKLYSSNSTQNFGGVSRSYYEGSAKELGLLQQNPDPNPDEGDGGETPVDPNPDEGEGETNPDQGGSTDPTDPDQGGETDPNPGTGDGGEEPVNPNPGEGEGETDPDQGGSTDPTDPDQGGETDPNPGTGDGGEEPVNPNPGEGEGETNPDQGGSTEQNPDENGEETPTPENPEENETEGEVTPIE